MIEIQSTNIIMLNRRDDLRHAQFGAWQSCGCPGNKIHYFEAHDGLDYESRDEVAQAAVDDGFPSFEWFLTAPDDYWMGVGEIACMWSISGLLREIANKPDGTAHFYVLADRFCKKDFDYMQQLINELPDFQFLQLKGHVPYDKERFDTERTPHWVEPNGSCIEPESIEYGGLKHGDGVLLMTPAGARWMLTCLERDPSLPYENTLLELGYDVLPAGIYSTPVAEYDFSEESTVWEGEFAHPFAGQESSDIGNANLETGTGRYQKPLPDSITKGTTYLKQNQRTPPLEHVYIVGETDMKLYHQKIGNLGDFGVPTLQVSAFLYPEITEKEDVCIRAIEDGFDVFHFYLNEKNTSWNWLGAKETFDEWRVCRALRDIAEGTSTVLFMKGAAFLRQDWWKIQELTARIKKDLRVLMLTYWNPEETWDGEKWCLSPREYEPSPTFTKPLPAPIEGLNYNFGGAGDYGLVLTPQGAKMLLDWITERSTKTGYLLDTRIWLESFTPNLGCYSVTDQHHWIGVNDGS